jgi:isopenicillin N synthase-like dioxygenase
MPTGIDGVMARSIPTVDFLLATSSNEADNAAFVRQVGDALKDIGFFALVNHGIPRALIDETYRQCDAFFDLDEATKRSYLRPEIAHQRGYTAFGVEHAKDNPAPDLKEFWQAGRGHDDRGVAPTYPANVWPSEHVPAFQPTTERLFANMEALSVRLLEACSRYLGQPADWLPNMAEEGNTIMRMIHYPPLGEDTPAGAVRSAAHEDINFITLLVTATADGLEVMDHDGTWIRVQGDQDAIIVDSGDMLQNLTNGLFKSTTHRVVNPKETNTRRYSMPMFVHPRNDVDLTPHPRMVEMTGGQAQFPSIKAGDYLQQRLREIGLI